VTSTLEFCMGTGTVSPREYCRNGNRNWINHHGNNGNQNGTGSEKARFFYKQISTLMTGELSSKSSNAAS